MSSSPGVQITGVNDYTGVLSLSSPGKGGHFYNVCGESWTSAENTVICRMLGFSLPVGKPPTLHVTPVTGVVWHVSCSGTEPSVWNCSHAQVERQCAWLAVVACAAPGEQARFLSSCGYCLSECYPICSGNLSPLSLWLCSWIWLGSCSTGECFKRLAQWSAGGLLRRKLGNDL